MNKKIYEEKFFNTIDEFIAEINKLNISNFKELSLPNKNIDILQDFFSKSNKYPVDFSTKNAIIFSQDSILSIIDLNLLWNQEISEDVRENIWKYLFTMYLYSYCYITEGDISTIIKDFKDIPQERIDNLKDKEKILYAIIDNINNEKRIKKMMKQQEKNNKKTNNIQLPDNIMSSNIGKLAKEIAEELNPNELMKELENKDPQKLFANLMQGNVSEGSSIFKLVNTIGSKINEKVLSGNLSETTLFNEAQDMINSNEATKNLFDNMKENEEDLMKNFAKNEAEVHAKTESKKIKKNSKLEIKKKNLKEKLKKQEDEKVKDKEVD
jgi:hypothetical protein